MKPIWKSKTVLINAAVALGLILDQLVMDGEALGLSPDMLRWVAFAVVCLNIVLRTVTKEGVTIKQGAQER